MMIQSTTSFVFILIILSLTFHGSFGRTLLQASTEQDDFVTCLQTNSDNFTAISQLVYTPSNSSYLPLWAARANNLRFNKSSTIKPSIIVTPTDETQIQTTLLCTKLHGYEMRIRCGGHDYEGLSYTGDVPFVMLDLVKMNSIDINLENQTIWVQGGTVQGELYYAISQKTNNSYFPGGTCPGVGVSGFLSGGGYGLLIRKYGLGVDNVLDARIMDVDGNILDRQSMGEDLFWAIRGGGSASFGIVLAWKLRLVPVDTITLFLVNVTLEQGATDIFYKYQYVVPFLDQELQVEVTINSESIGNTANKTIRMLFHGHYQGKIDTLLPLLDRNFPELNVTREMCEEVTMVQSTLAFAGLPTSTPLAALTNRSAYIKPSHKTKSDYVRTPIPKSGLIKIWEKMFENDKSEVIITYTYGGKMDELTSTETPYAHRPGVLYQMLKSVNLIDQPSDTTLVSQRRIAWLRSFENTLEPYVTSNPREAYRNTVDLDLGIKNNTYEEASVWGERYWKSENFKRLISIKAKVDPQNFFRFPQSIPVFPTQ